MKILFIPVSGKEGIGEYMRSIILAQSINASFPNVEIHFVLSSEAPYSHTCPYPTLITKRSPTYHTKEISQYITSFKPDVVIFDASGRAKQIKFAKEFGAKTIFIAQHDKKIRTGLKTTRLIHTDLILIAQPSFAVEEISRWSNYKINLFNKPKPIFLGCIFVPPTKQQEEDILKKYNLIKNNYIFISAGSGGHYLANKKLAAEVFNKATLEAKLELNYVQVWGANYQGDKLPENDEDNLNLTDINNLEFITLLKNSKIALVNGGGTLLQALALQVPVVAIPVSSDQPQRIENSFNYLPCFVLADADISSIAQALNKLKQESTFNSIKQLLLQVKINNGYNIMPEIIKKLTTNKKKYLLYAEQNYAYSMLRPLQEEILQRGNEVRWFLAGKQINKKYLLDKEVELNSITEVKKWQPDIVIAPGNIVPKFIPGIKVNIFHGFNVAKATRSDDEGHFNIRGCYDLYCTQGPATTEGFQQRAKKYGFFQAIETGWPTLDPIFLNKFNQCLFNNDKPTVLYCSTFTKKLSSASRLFEIIKRLRDAKDWNWIIQFHPKMPRNIVEKYKTLQADNLIYTDTDNVLTVFNSADVMLSDTSSATLMFAVYGKPIVTYKNRTLGDTSYLMNVETTDAIEAKLEEALAYPEKIKTKIHKAADWVHPYRDGKSSARVLDAIDNFLSNDYKKLKPKPFNFFRSLKERAKLNYWWF